MTPVFDAAAFRAAMLALYTDLRRAAQRGLTDAVEAAAKSAQDTPLFNDVSGALRKSITYSVWARDLGGRSFVSARAPGLEGEVVAGVGAPHVRFVECGTDPHEITPRRKQVLRFVQNGRVVFATRVMHPGTKARPFMGVAADVGQQVLDYSVDYYVGDAIASFNASGS